MSSSIVKVVDIVELMLKQKKQNSTTKTTAKMISSNRKSRNRNEIKMMIRKEMNEKYCKRKLMKSLMKRNLKIRKNSASVECYRKRNA